MPGHAQILRQLADLDPDGFFGWAVDDDGTTAVAVWKGDPLGTNPDHVYQIFKWELPGGALTQLTSFPEGLTRNVSITDDGEWIVFDSRADPVQQNGDGSPELFLVRSDGTDITQLTNDDLLGGGIAECPAISGSGNRVLFYGTYDPNGTNPDHLTQLFVLDLASSNLTQLTQGDSELHVPYSAFFSDSKWADARCYPSISDDGERIAFSSSANLTGINPSGWPQVFTITADGQNLSQIHWIGGSGWHYAWGISGNGERIVFLREQNSGEHGVGSIWVVNWDNTGHTSLTSGSQPTIRDDGTRVYYGEVAGSETSHLFFIVVATLGERQLTPSEVSVVNRAPVVSGSGDRIVFLAEHGEYPGGSNPDEGPEIMAMAGPGSDVQQLTVSGRRDWAFEPDITADGSRVVYRAVSDANVNAKAPAEDLAYGLYYVDTDGSDPVSVITHEDRNSFETPTITADGETIVFMSWEDLAGPDPICGNSERDVFRVQADGTGLAHLTLSDDCGVSGLPVVASNGSLVVFQSTEYGTGDGAGLFSIPLAGGGVTTVYEDGASYYKIPMVSADGVWTAWHSGFPSPQGTEQVFRGLTDGSLAEALTDDPDHPSRYPDISGDGRFVTFHSESDPLGTNADHNSEIFLHDAQTESTQQLTATSEGWCHQPIISEDGEWVYFKSTSPFFGPAIPNTHGTPVFRVSVATGVIERAGNRFLVPYFWWEHPNLAVDADGGRAVFVSQTAPTGERLPRSYDVWLSDFDTPATIRPSAETPTVVEWDPDPRAVSYDVIRGDVANLAAGAGNTVDLGTVVCLENDTFNTNTAGAEADPVQPAPGQVFFFLRRWTQGFGDTPSYGQGTGAAERVPSAGDCPQ
jgi:Tol biopolymer transport system component